MSYIDPITGNVVPQEEHKKTWRERTTALVAEPPTNLEEACQRIYEFLDKDSQGRGGEPPAVPLCEHAPDSYSTDHALLTSAIAYCLGYGREGVDLNLLRLAAMAHDFPDDVRQKLAAGLSVAEQETLESAWGVLDAQRGWLERVVREGGFPTGEEAKLPAGDFAAILWQAHLAASASLGDEKVADEWGERWVPSSKDGFSRHPLAGAEDKVGLVYGGATKIKGYVFESARLPEVRGASALFDRINLEDVPALWGKQNKISGEVAALVQAPECVIFASGGNFLALAPIAKAKELADAVEKRYTDETLVGNSAAVSGEFALLELQYGRQPNTYWCDDYEEDLKSDLRPILEAYYSYPKELAPGTAKGRFYQRKTFGELVTVLAGKMMRRRGGWGEEDGRLQRYIPHYELLPYAVKCHSCDVRPAMVAFRAEDTPAGQSPRVYCEPCARKRVAGQVAKQDDSEGNTRWFREAFPSWWPKGVISWEQRFEIFLDGNPENRAQYFSSELAEHPNWRGEKVVNPANDLREIAHGSKLNRYIGLIYADGNNVGARVARLRTPAEYRRFSHALSAATERAVFAALAEHLEPVWIESALDPERPSRAKIWIHPFEIITIGGDDLILIVPGSKALDIALSIGQRLEKMLGGPTSGDKNLYEGQRYRAYEIGDQGLEPVEKHWLYEPRISLSAGVVIAHETTPIFFLHNLAEQLLKSAKRRRKKRSYPAGTVDFLALKSLGMVASRLKEFRERAYKLDDGRWLTARPYTWVELRGLLDTVRTVQPPRGLGRTQLYRFQDSLMEGQQSASINYLYSFSRLSSTERRALAKAFNLAWHGKNDIPPWRRREDGDGVETIWRDLIEIYDFVEPKKREEA